MINSPRSNTSLQIIAETTAPTYTTCSSDITSARSEFCRDCVHMINVDSITQCELLLLDINLIITSNEIICPEENW